MDFLEVFGVTALLLVWGAQVLKRPSIRRLARQAWVVAILGVFGFLLFLSLRQYLAWETDTLSKFLLPPYQEIGYFTLYAFSRLWGPWLIALGAGFLCGAAAQALNRRFGDRFFEPEEPHLFALGIFLTGYPGFLLYLACMLALGAAFSLIYAARGWGRAPLSYLWLPVAVSVIIMKSWFVPASLLHAFAL